MNMRPLFALTYLLFCCLALSAVSKVPPLPNRGYFGGELSVYASGDTIMYVYLNTEDSSDTSERYARFRISIDAGYTWQEHTIPQALDRRTRPTLTILDDGILVNLDRYQYISTDQGQSWTFFDELPAVWESSPYFYDRNGELAHFELNLPYPEWEQYDFVMEGSETELLKPYSYYLENDISMNNTPMPWTSDHSLSGILRANSGLHIKQAGGGDNDGWPTFVDKVIIGGEVSSSPQNYPANQVFQGGLLDHQPMGEMPWDNPARQAGYWFGQGEGHIYLLVVDGSSFSGWHGVISEPREVVTPVYSEYPPNEDSTILYNNVYTVRDTTWSSFPGGISSGRTLFVDGELWIRGQFSGEQTWVASGDIKLIDNILLTNTSYADDPIYNYTDCLNLVSEKNIVIKYAYVNPADSIRMHCFLGNHYGPSYIYANLYALGTGEREGLFTFEYQHPHPSTPAVELEVDGETVLYDNIDLHRYRYPPTAEEPWPAHIDLPWHNPIWPEKAPFLDRGPLIIHGNIYQRKHGYLHRAHNDSDYPSNSGVWDIENDLCGGPTNPVPYPDPVIDGLVLLSRDFQGTPGDKVGYNVTLHNEKRAQFLSDENSWYHRFWDHGIQLKTDDYSRWTHNARFSTAVKSKHFGHRDGKFVLGANDALLYDTVNSVHDYSSATKGRGTILGVQLDADSRPVVLQYQAFTDFYGESVLNLISFTTGTQEVFNLLTIETLPNLIGFCSMPDNRIILAIYQAGFINLYELDQNGETHLMWSKDFSANNLWGSRLYLIPAGQDILDLFIWETSDPAIRDNWGYISHERVPVPVSNTDATAPVVLPATITTYPNPFNPSTTISYSLPTAGNINLDIFNLKGQKVKSLARDEWQTAGTHQSVWHGLDEMGRPVSSGIYLIRLTTKDKSLFHKVMLMK